MPKENTHLWLAHQVLGRLEDAEHRTAFSDLKKYYLGSVAPDSFFYFSQWFDVSERLHGKNGEKTNGIVFRMLDSSTDLAFVYGYLTHCAADMVFHPFVFSMSGSYNTREGRHRHHRLETYIDHMLNSEFYIDEMLYAGLADGLAFSRLIEGVPEDAFRKSLQRQIMLNRLFRKRFLYAPAMILDSLRITDRRISGLFYHSLTRQQESFEYPDPVSGKKMKKSLQQMASESAALAVKLINAASLYSSNPKAAKIIRGESLATGRVGKGVDSMKFFARHAEIP